MKSARPFLLLSTLSLALGIMLPAQSQSLLEPRSFAVETPDAPAPKAQTLRVSLLDQGISDISRSLMLNVAYRQLFATDESQQQGYVFSAHFHHLMNTHPALLNRFLQAEEAGFYPSFSEIGLGVGHRFSYENFALIPQAHFRNLFALGQNVSQHLIGFEPGVRLEYWIYPEVTKLSVDYGFNVPFLHLANQESNISPFTLSLHRIYTELSYRLFENVELVSGFYWWQVPSQLGSGSITNTTLSNVTGFQIGAGLAF
jgi:hypothetical protein